MATRSFLSVVSGFVLAAVVSVMMTVALWTGGCGSIQMVEEETATIFGKVISRRVGVAVAQRYPGVAELIEPIANAILEATANGEDLITVLKKGIDETPSLDPLTKKDMQDLMNLITVNNAPDVYREIAKAFLEGLAMQPVLS